MSFTNSRTLCLGLALVVLAAYANHFQNDFHFDDTETIVANLSIRNLANIPRFFTDATLFSAQVGGQTWRPLVTTSLAIDYWLGGGLKPFFFHFSTFCWYLLQLLLMFFLFRRLMDSGDPHPSNTWTALLAVACYGLHPANAETVNYIIQRGDLYTTLGVVASLLWFVARPAQRKFGWYLIPAIAAFLSKAPALIYPFILFAYVFLFEAGQKWLPALRATVPAFVVTAAAAVLTILMTPATFVAGATSPWLYRLTQSWIALRYFASFFLPISLSADHDWTLVSSPFSEAAFAGYLFVAALIVVTIAASRRPPTRPVAFGIVWFILALLPVALYPLADVAKDHRMFFPFVGLALAVTWVLRLALFHWTARLTTNRLWLRAGLAAAAAILLAAAIATRARNEVWHSEESLWRDVAMKSPGNPGGLSNYGNILLSAGDFTGAISYFERAQSLRPEDAVTEVRLANAYAGLGRDADAARHYERAGALDPNGWGPHFFYGRWLLATHRTTPAWGHLLAALRINPQSFAARYLMMQLLCEMRDWPALDAVIAETLRLAPSDEVARGYSAETARRPPGQGPPPERLLSMATTACDSASYDACLFYARQALAVRPDYSEAYYVASGALLSRGRKADALHALQMALRIKPDFEAAKRALTGAVD